MCRICDLHNIKLFTFCFHMPFSSRTARICATLTLAKSHAIDHTYPSDGYVLFAMCDTAAEAYKMILAAFVLFVGFFSLHNSLSLNLHPLHIEHIHSFIHIHGTLFKYLPSQPNWTSHWERESKGATFLYTLHPIHIEYTNLDVEESSKKWQCPFKLSNFI